MSLQFAFNETKTFWNPMCYWGSVPLKPQFNWIIFYYSLQKKLEINDYIRKWQLLKPIIPTNRLNIVQFFVKEKN